MRRTPFARRFFILAVAVATAAPSLAAQIVAREVRKPATATPAPLPAPANFTAVRANDGVQLHWGTVPNATGYWLYRTAEPNGKEDLIGNLPTVESTAFFDRDWTKTKGSATYRVVATVGNRPAGSSASVRFVPPLEQKIALPAVKRP